MYLYGNLTPNSSFPSIPIEYALYPQAASSQLSDIGIFPSCQNLNMNAIKIIIPKKKALLLSL